MPCQCQYKIYQFKGGYRTKNVRACVVTDTARTIFSFENQSYIGEFEAEFNKALARESGARGYYLMKKKLKVEISLHRPFKSFVMRFGSHNTELRSRIMLMRLQVLKIIDPLAALAPVIYPPFTL
jgi:hypothetical protein